MSSRSSQTVLLTGGTGFIASHILDYLLDDGYRIVVTVRSEEKGQRILSSLDQPSRERVSFVVVQDVAESGAFDQAVRTEPPLDYVIHTASPYHFNVQDPVRDFLDPAIKGTEGILHSIHQHAPSVKRVVITSSSAAMLNPGNHAAIYDESCWAPMTWEEAMLPENTYRASKAKKAAWSFMTTQNPTFDLVVINNTYTFGPVPKHLAHLDALNTSNHRIRDLVQGRMRERLAPTAPVFTFVDVRDVASAHVRALAKSEAGGKRFYLVGGHFSNKRLADIIRDAYPALHSRLPPADVADDFPEKVYQFDNSRSRKVLGIEYIDLATSVKDTVASMLELGTDGME